LIETADLRPKQAEAGDLHGCEAFPALLQLTWQRYRDAGHAFHQQEAAMSGRRRGGWLGCSPVSWGVANGVRQRRGATESIRHARVSTMSSPALRVGFLTHHGETDTSGALRNRQPPVT